jgi:Rrf2 family protein
MYGKQTECAIAVMSRLAEVYDGGTTRLSAADIADSRGLQRPFVAKTLSALSQAGLVTGSRGPGGGSTLARDPKKIKLYDVYKLFEREDRNDTCPFGGGICGAGKPCPIHNKLVSVQQAMDRLLHKTTFADFRPGRGQRTGSSSKRKTKGKRASYRATRTTPHKRRSPGP